MKVLGIETSCDETSVAVLNGFTPLANLISSQDFHTRYGGVVPELSSRAHIQQLAPLLRSALSEAGVTLSQIDAIAATAGPGLIGALLVGFTFGKGLAFSTGLPFIPVNHIEGHIFSGFLMPQPPEFPMLVLVVSGGHTMLVFAKSFTDLTVVAATVDDAVGEAFDKVAKMIGLGYPGGPAIQKAAASGNPTAVSIPIARLAGGHHFSFSGIKTSVLRHIQKTTSNNTRLLLPQEKADIAASFQATAIKALIKSTGYAIEQYRPKSLSLVGGVAANAPLREAFTALGGSYGCQVVVPAFSFCGDNAAMIALRGSTLFTAGKQFSLSADAFPSFQSAYVRYAE